MIGIWAIGKALTKKQYAEAFDLLSAYKYSSNENVKGLIEVLTRILREEHVVKKIQKAY